MKNVKYAELKEALINNKKSTIKFVKGDEYVDSEISSLVDLIKSYEYDLISDCVIRNNDYQALVQDGKMKVVYPLLFGVVVQYNNVTINELLNVFEKQVKGLVYRDSVRNEIEFLHYVDDVLIDHVEKVLNKIAKSNEALYVHSDDKIHIRYSIDDTFIRFTYNVNTLITEVDLNEFLYDSPDEDEHSVFKKDVEIMQGLSSKSEALMEEDGNKYKRKITNRAIQNGYYMDVYDLDVMWKEPNSAVLHARKKLMNLGNRSGGKSRIQDIEEAIKSLQEALVLEKGGDI